jgi:hypothetical protein
VFALRNGNATDPLVLAETLEGFYRNEVGGRFRNQMVTPVGAYVRPVFAQHLDLVGLVPPFPFERQHACWKKCSNFLGADKRG